MTTLGMRDDFTLPEGPSLRLDEPDAHLSYITELGPYLRATFEILWFIVARAKANPSDTLIAAKLADAESKLGVLLGRCEAIFNNGLAPPYSPPSDRVRAKRPGSEAQERRLEEIMQLIRVARAGVMEGGECRGLAGQCVRKAAATWRRLCAPYVHLISPAAPVTLNRFWRRAWDLPPPLQRPEQSAHSKKLLARETVEYKKRHRNFKYT